MSTPVYETMRRFISGDHTIRLWIGSWLPATVDRIEQQAREIALQGARASTDDLADVLGKLHGVNAVEVLDHDGNGHLVYPEWP